LEKKFKFTNNPTAAKVIYGVVVAILCITAIVVGIVAANSRKDDAPPIEENPPISDGTQESPDNQQKPSQPDTTPDTKPQKEKTTYISPVSGQIITAHSLTTPVFSETLEEWRVHTGIDISTEEGADVFASANGEITSVYSHPLLGNTVVLTHADGVKTVYSNLASDDSLTVGKKVNQGEKIGKVGDSSISELAKEAHLHFEVMLNDVSVNPLDYLTEESKEVSLGIKP
jgi:murein DD-endopeptidase MepM/ murein hydrolase activator NlpD